MNIFAKISAGIAAHLIAVTGYATTLQRPEVSIIAPDQWYVD